MVEAVRKYKRVCQVGTQQRSMFRNREASELVRNGRLGKLQEVLCHNWAGARPYTDFDLLGEPMKWTDGNFADLKGQTVSLRFALRDGQFYSWWIE